MDKLKPNIFAQACPSREIFSRVSGKWTIMILLSLETKPLRFNELKKLIDENYSNKSYSIKPRIRF